MSLEFTFCVLLKKAWPPVPGDPEQAVPILLEGEERSARCLPVEPARRRPRMVHLEQGPLPGGSPGSSGRRLRPAPSPRRPSCMTHRWSPVEASGCGLFPPGLPEIPPPPGGGRWGDSVWPCVPGVWARGWFPAFSFSGVKLPELWQPGLGVDMLRFSWVTAWRCVWGWRPPSIFQAPDVHLHSAFSFS